MHLPSRQMGTIATEHWVDTSGDYSALPTSQQCPVIPPTALMMTHISRWEKRTFSLSFCFLCLISSFWYISKKQIFPLSASLIQNKSNELSSSYLQGQHVPHDLTTHQYQSPCPNTIARSLPPPPMSTPFRRKDG